MVDSDGIGITGGVRHVPCDADHAVELSDLRFGENLEEEAGLAAFGRAVEQDAAHLEIVSILAVARKAQHSAQQLVHLRNTGEFLWTVP